MILDLQNEETELKVVLTTNFSKGSRNSCQYAIDLFGDKNVEYILLNSYFEPPLGHDGLVSKDELLSRKTNLNLKEEKELIERSNPNLELKIQCVSYFGILQSAINDTAHKYGAQYVVLGNKKDFSLESRLLRYKTANFIRKIECAVLAIPQDAVFDSNNEVTFASDMKRIKDLNVLTPLIPVMQKHQSNLNILYVSKNEEVLAGEQAENGLLLDRFFASVPHEFHHADNDFIISGISRFIESSHAGMVVMLARKHNFFRRLVEASNTEMMSELARIPMLVLHE